MASLRSVIPLLLEHFAYLSAGFLSKINIVSVYIPSTVWQGLEDSLILAFRNPIQAQQVPSQLPQQPSYSK